MKDVLLAGCGATVASAIPPARQRSLARPLARSSALARPFTRSLARSLSALGLRLSHYDAEARRCVRVLDGLVLSGRDIGERRRGDGGIVVRPGEKDLPRLELLRQWHVEKLKQRRKKLRLIYLRHLKKI